MDCENINIQILRPKKYENLIKIVLEFHTRMTEGRSQVKLEKLVHHRT